MLDRLFETRIPEKEGSDLSSDPTEIACGFLRFVAGGFR